MKRKLNTLLITDQQLDDLISACSFTIREYEKLIGMKTPNYIKSVTSVFHKGWKIIHARKKESGAQ